MTLSLLEGQRSLPSRSGRFAQDQESKRRERWSNNNNTSLSFAIRIRCASQTTNSGTYVVGNALENTQDRGNADTCGNEHTARMRSKGHGE
eukprot:gene24691-biopygen10176